MDAIEPSFGSIPPEIMNYIFAELDGKGRAKYRCVCTYWRNIIESLYHTYLEMDNCNWEAYVKGTTASKLRVKFTSLQYPIYTAPEFKDFVPRVNILELSGFIPTYNVVNILKEFRHLLSLVLHNVRLDTYEHLVDTKWTKAQDRTDLHLDLKELTLGRPFSGEEEDLFVLANHVGSLLKDSSLRTLNLKNSFYMKEDILKIIYIDIFMKSITDDSPFDTSYRNIVIARILLHQNRSIQEINFNGRYILPAYPDKFIKFHRQGSTSLSIFSDKKREFAQIQESCFFNFSAYYFDLSFTKDLLKIYEIQSRMQNLVIRYATQEDLDQIEKIVKNNCETLKKITIVSDELLVSPYRVLSCKLFSPCRNLEQLTLSNDCESRKVKLLDILALPSSLKALSLDGFIATVTSEWFGVSGLSQFVNLTRMTLSQLPWFIHDENPVVGFSSVYLHHLLISFSKVKKLTLKVTPPSRFVSREVANFCGIESIPDPVPQDFVTWCQNGGNNNEIDSIQTSQEERWNLIPENVYKILIRNQ